MIFIGIGANLPSRAHGSPRATCEAAIFEIEARGIRVVARSRWFTSAPVPPSDQPWYVNGVIGVETDLDPDALLKVLHDVEAVMGRQRKERWGARTLDLDLLDYHGDVVEAAAEAPEHKPLPRAITAVVESSAECRAVLPHPRMHERAFVLVPLSELAPNWRHPVTGETIDALLAKLPGDQSVKPLT